MTRLVTAPSVGALVGALEGGILMRSLAVIDSRSGPLLGGNDETIMVAFFVGLIFGGIAGAVIGIVVALTQAKALIGLAIGTLGGITMALLFFTNTSPDDDMLRILAAFAIPCLGSIGLLSAALTHARKES